MVNKKQSSTVLDNLPFFPDKLSKLMARGFYYVSHGPAESDYHDSPMLNKLAEYFNEHKEELNKELRKYSKVMKERAYKL